MTCETKKNGPPDASGCMTDSVKSPDGVSAGFSNNDLLNVVNMAFQGAKQRYYDFHAGNEDTTFMMWMYCFNRVAAAFALDFETMIADDERHEPTTEAVDGPPN